MAKHICFLLFENAETLDYSGPLEVFGTLRDVSQQYPKITFVSVDKLSFHDRYGLHITSEHFFYQVKEAPDVLIIPGGRGVKALIDNKTLHEWINKIYKEGTVLFSVCTGALVLAAAGLLKDKKAITHHNYLGEIKNLEPYVSINSSSRYVFDQNILSSGGVSAGIDAALWYVKENYGLEACDAVVKDMEYYSDPNTTFSV